MQSFITDYGKGIIQKSRKKADKANTTTYGLLTDGLRYEFSKISNGSKVFSISCSFKPSKRLITTRSQDHADSVPQKISDISISIYLIAFVL